MATFIKGVTDQFGPLQLYRPDYQFLTQVYGTRQAQYDRGFNMVKSLYNSVLNNSVTNQENENFRQEAFKKLQGSLKSMSNVDLSNPANVMRAQTLIDPISKDEELAYDMSVTRFHQKQKQLMETYRNSTDPKMRNLYSDFSRMDIALAEEDLRNAKRGDGSIMKVQPREFTPFEDVQEYLRTEAKKQGLEIVQSGPDNQGYILKRTNGVGAVPVFDNWAKVVMGNKFDRQFSVVGRVNAEQAIRGTMSAQNVSREEATRIVAEKLLPEVNVKESTKGITYDKEYKKLDEEVRFFERQYPNGFPPSKPEIAQEYQKLVQARDEYKTEFENARNEVGRLQQEGAAYVAGNIYNIFTKAAKDQTAYAFAATYATANQGVEMRPDTTWSTKVSIASRERIAGAQLAMEGRKLNWDINKTMMSNQLKVLELQGKGYMPSEQLLGAAVSDKPAYASDQLSASTAQSREQAFMAAFNGENGLMKLVVENDSEYSRVYSSIAKLKSIGAGQNVKLDQQDIKNLNAYGERLGVRIGMPNSPATANALLESLSSLTYTAATNSLEKYSRAHKTAKLNPYMESFRNGARAFQTISAQIDKNQEDMLRIAREVLNPDGTVKSMYKGAVVRSAAGGKIADIDLSGVSEAGKANLTKLVSGFKDRENPVMNRYNFSKLSAAEIDLFVRNPYGVSSVATSEGGNIDMSVLKNLNTADLAKLFGNQSSVFYDGVNKQVKVELNVSQDGDMAKKLGVKGGQSLYLTIPYETILSARGAYPRLAKYIGANSINTTSLGEFTPFLTNPSARVVAPAHAEKRKFDWTATGVVDKTGRPHIQIDFKFLNPKTDKIEEMSRLVPFTPGNVESIQEALDLVSGIDVNYMLGRSKFEENLNNQR